MPDAPSVRRRHLFVFLGTTSLSVSTFSLIWIQRRGVCQIRAMKALQMLLLTLLLVVAAVNGQGLSGFFKTFFDVSF
jgi:hypothetical protein